MSKKEKYFLRMDEKSTLMFKRPDETTGSIKTSIFIDAVKEFENIMAVFENLEIPIGDILGLRNLSAFVGEVYNLACYRVSNNYIKNNPHQDGYPDLLIMDKIGKKLWDSLHKRRREKEPFSPFMAGGIEVKATCGDLRTAKWFSEKGLEKPTIGEQRLQYVTGYNWKAHHRETNNLIGIIWDFIDNKPTIVALAYSNQLIEDDWGVQPLPKKGGGRTTSVSIIKKSGMSKMVQGLILHINDDFYDERMLNRLERY